MWNKITTPPTKDGKYLVVIGNGPIDLLNFNQGMWWGPSYRMKGLPIAVTHWMELPKPPDQQDWVKI